MRASKRKDALWRLQRIPRAVANLFHNRQTKPNSSVKISEPSLCRTPKGFAGGRLFNAHTISDPQAGSRLLNLPPELRVLIWREYLGGLQFWFRLDNGQSYHSDQSFRTDDRTKMGLPSLVTSCRKLYVEMNTMLYDERNNAISMRECFISMTTAFFPVRINFIQQLTLGWGMSEPPVSGDHRAGWVKFWKQLATMRDLEVLTVEISTTQEGQEQWQLHEEELLNDAKIITGPFGNKRMFKFEVWLDWWEDSRRLI